ncbi:MAG: hypothetical protein IPH76_07065 [Xanthomonadales bacterium]|nr:hypothetical protein [Xanthomonadales bacterium]
MQGLDEVLRRAASATSVAAAPYGVALDAADEFAARYPHQLFRRPAPARLMIALALASSPQLLIADEITSALDPLAAQGVLDLLDRLRRERALAGLFIIYDLRGVRRVAARVLPPGCTPARSMPGAGGRLLRSTAEPAGGANGRGCGTAPAFAAGSDRSADPEVSGLGADSRTANRRCARSRLRWHTAPRSAWSVRPAKAKSTLARAFLALQRGHAQSLRIAGADPFALRRRCAQGVAAQGADRVPGPGRRSIRASVSPIV